MGKRSKNAGPLAAQRTTGGQGAKGKAQKGPPPVKAQQQTKLVKMAKKIAPKKPVLKEQLDPAVEDYSDERCAGWCACVRLDKQAVTRDPCGCSGSELDTPFDDEGMNTDEDMHDDDEVGSMRGDVAVPYGLLMTKSLTDV
jgi:hypothetical protein